MKISAVQTNSRNSFGGDYWIVTDCHARLKPHCGTLSAIDKDIRQSKEQVTFIDAGDYFLGSYPMKYCRKVFEKFRDNNKNINMIFNLGNAELGSLGYGFSFDKNLFEEFVDTLASLKKKGVKVLSTSASLLDERTKGLIDEYAIIDDVIDGKKQKVLVIGTANTTDRSNTLEKQKELLKKTYQKVLNNNEKYDLAILISHNGYGKNDITDKLLDYAKEDLKIKNLKLVVGGHPHSLHDEQIGQTRLIYSAPHGKSAIKLHLTSAGVVNPLFKSDKDSYDYSQLEAFRTNPDWVVNYDINNMLPISKDYQDILNQYPQIDRVIAKMPFDIKYRNYAAKLNEPCELGTFLSNAIRDICKADIGISLTQDFREKLPEKNQNLTEYALFDSFNVSKNIYKIKDVYPKDIKRMFEASLANQKVISNSNFLEYSDNIKVERYDTDKPQKVKQISIFVDNKWIDLLDKNGNINKEIENKPFSIATCAFLANVQKRSKLRAGFEVFEELSLRKNYEPEPCIINGVAIKNTDAFSIALKKAADAGVKSVKNAQMITV